ncbi:hypothetical protein AMAG_18642 [Allomyces macrogynus ATCC 38327]|uniref:Uncharacterized protein n=1 Tax=Allomyces macrogynus (strain ATCC 38327) TaxID=578462 RepID=A0A0L0SGM2_ALLM3|nr:hypothetical protein AMAG_18642 [Allomyces macrogynus ATCC 38327]|eukprot:KNE61500.1 hypothetical protein AMAG_18642 [Allomyces macrogynus ATCC 38327]
MAAVPPLRSSTPSSSTTTAAMAMAMPLPPPRPGPAPAPPAPAPAPAPAAASDDADASAPSTEAPPQTQQFLAANWQPATGAGAPGTAAPTPVARTPQTLRKQEFVHALVRTAAEIIGALTPKPAVEPTVPLHDFIAEILRRSKSSFSTLQLALFYLFKYRAARRRIAQRAAALAAARAAAVAALAANGGSAGLPSPPELAMAAAAGGSGGASSSASVLASAALASKRAGSMAPPSSTSRHPIHAMAAAAAALALPPSGGLGGAGYLSHSLVAQSNVRDTLPSHVRAKPAHETLSPENQLEPSPSRAAALIRAAAAARASASPASNGATPPAMPMPLPPPPVTAPPPLPRAYSDIADMPRAGGSLVAAIAGGLPLHAVPVSAPVTVPLPVAVPPLPPRAVQMPMDVDPVPPAAAASPRSASKRGRPAATPTDVTARSPAAIAALQQMPPPAKRARSTPPARAPSLSIAFLTHAADTPTPTMPLGGAPSPAHGWVPDATAAPGMPMPGHLRRNGADDGASAPR